LKHASFHYDSEQDVRIFDSIQQIFNRATIDRLLAIVQRDISGVGAAL